MRYRLLALLSFILLSSSEAATLPADLFPGKTVYFGANIGGGYTTWEYLVNTTDKNGSTLASTPESVSEGGPSWGVVFGFDVSKNFAIELQYMQFANANIRFAAASGYAYHYHITSMISKTDAYSLSGKFLAQIANTHMRAFAAVGVGTVERHDVLYSGSCVTPYMSTGLVYSFTRHWMLESGFQYYTGFGSTELLPVLHYIPFAWDGYVRLAYQL